MNVICLDSRCYCFLVAQNRAVDCIVFDCIFVFSFCRCGTVNYICFNSNDPVWFVLLTGLNSIPIVVANSTNLLYLYE